MLDLLTPALVLVLSGAAVPALALAMTARAQPWLGYLLAGFAALLALAYTGHGDSVLFWIANGLFFMSAAAFGIPSFRAALCARWLANRLGPRLRALGQLRRSVRGAERGRVLQPGPDQMLLDGTRGWKRFLSLPAARFSPAEQSFLDGPLEALALELERSDVDREGAFARLAEQRLLGADLPTRAGGRGFSIHLWSACVRRLAVSDPLLAADFAAASPLCAMGVVAQLGNACQIQSVLPDVARGRARLALVDASSEGSASGGAVLTRREFEGRTELELRLDLIAGATPLAAGATHLLAIVELDDPRELLGQVTGGAHLALLLPRDTPGLEFSGHPAAGHAPAANPQLGAPQLGAVRAEGCRVPLECVLGGLRAEPDVVAVLAAARTRARAIQLPALVAGTAEFAARAVERESAAPGANTGPNTDRGPERAAWRAGRANRLTAIRHLTESARQLGLAALRDPLRPGPFAAALRARTAELAIELRREALALLHDGSAASTAVHVLEGLPQPLCIDGERSGGTALDWCRGGAHLFAEELEHELDALDVGDLAAFEAAAAAHLTRLAARSARALIDGLRGGRSPKSPAAGIAADLFRRAEHVSRLQAICAEWIPLALGSELERQPEISGRLAASRGWIAMAAASLREFHARGQREGERRDTTAAVELALERAIALLDEALLRLRAPRTASLLRALMFPLGRPRPGSGALPRVEPEPTGGAAPNAPLPVRDAELPRPMSAPRPTSRPAHSAAQAAAAQNPPGNPHPPEHEPALTS